MELAIVVWIFCGIGAAFVAQSRGASGCLWFGLGVLLGPFGLAFAFASGTDRKCPHCRERVHPEATRCPKCQAGLASSGPVAGEDDPRTLALVAAVAHDSGSKSTANPPTKKCPDCAEDVRAEARKCRFCGFVFPEPSAVDQEPAQPEPEPISAPMVPPEESASLAGEEVSAPQLDEEAWRAWATQPKKGFNYKVLALAALALVAVLSIGYVLSPKEHPTETAANTTPVPDTGGGTVAAQQKEKPAPVVRTENTISIDTSGCQTFDQIVALAGSSTNSMPGCIDLDRGQRVIGPLEVRGSRMGSSNFDFARIEVPGKGERWTFLAHLAK